MPRRLQLCVFSFRFYRHYLREATARACSSIRRQSCYNAPCTLPTLRETDSEKQQQLLIQAAVERRGERGGGESASQPANKNKESSVLRQAGRPVGLATFVCDLGFGRLGRFSFAGRSDGLSAAPFRPSLSSYPLLTAAFPFRLSDVPNRPRQLRQSCHCLQGSPSPAGREGESGRGRGRGIPARSLVPSLDRRRRVRPSVRRSVEFFVGTSTHSTRTEDNGPTTNLQEG